MEIGAELITSKTQLVQVSENMTFQQRGTLLNNYHILELTLSLRFPSYPKYSLIVSSVKLVETIVTVMYL